MSAIDDLTPSPDQPEISEGNQTFHQKAYALYKWMRERLAPAIVEMRDLIINSVTGAFSGTSTTSVTITDTGEVSIATDAGRSFKPGTPVRLAYVTDPLNYIDGITKTYNATTGAFVFFAQSKAGSGTYNSWSLTIIPSGGGLAGLGSNTYVGNQFVPDEVYDASGWNGDLSVPTKKSIRDKIEAILSAILNATNDPTFTSTSSTDPVSPEWFNGRVAALSFGIGQSWQDLTSSRASGTTYTNTTGKTIFVQCNASGYGTGAGNGPEFFVNGVLVQRFKYFLGAGQYIQANVGGFVPPGGTYLINAAGMNTWMEWR